ncbi:DNA-directed RNA polymerase insert domain [Trinorchestia longiramus]|nr:DNA-directed RNA polymerase insert domain [Trinorchestia longiramus]
MIYSDKYELGQFVLSPDPTAVQPSKQKPAARKSSSPFSDDCYIKIHKMDNKNMEIDFIGFHFSLINAYRRIVLAEVATVAIEKVYMYKNTSVVQDEVLAHRIGLVPLNVPPHLFNFKPADSDQYTEDNCVKYKLRVKCRGKKDSRVPTIQTEDDVDTTLVDKLVTTDDLEWVPMGNQATVFALNPLTPLREKVSLPPQVEACNTSLVLAKLKPGQRLLLEAYAFKGLRGGHSISWPTAIMWFWKISNKRSFTISDL